MSNPILKKKNMDAKMKKDLIIYTDLLEGTCIWMLILTRESHILPNLHLVPIYVN